MLYEDLRAVFFELLIDFIIIFNSSLFFLSLFIRFAKYSNKRQDQKGADRLKLFDL